MDSNNTQSAAQKRSKATNLATLRAVVAGYLIYLGGSLIYDWMKGSGMPSVQAWGLGLLFAAAGAGYGLYTWKRWQQDRAAAEAGEEQDDRTV